jgi:hypothetical protein
MVRRLVGLAVVMTAVIVIAGLGSAPVRAVNADEGAGIIGGAVPVCGKYSATSTPCGGGTWSCPGGVQNVTCPETANYVSGTNKGTVSAPIPFVCTVCGNQNSCGTIQVSVYFAGGCSS